MFQGLVVGVVVVVVVVVAKLLFTFHLMALKMTLLLLTVAVLLLTKLTTADFSNSGAPNQPIRKHLDTIPGSLIGKWYQQGLYHGLTLGEKRFDQHGIEWNIDSLEEVRK